MSTTRTALLSRSLPQKQPRLNGNCHAMTAQGNMCVSAEEVEPGSEPLGSGELIVAPTDPSQEVREVEAKAGLFLGAWDRDEHLAMKSWTLPRL